MISGLRNDDQSPSKQEYWLAISQQMICSIVTNLPAKDHIKRLPITFESKGSKWKIWNLLDVNFLKFCFYLWLGRILLIQLKFGLCAYIWVSMLATPTKFSCDHCCSRLKNVRRQDFCPWLSDNGDDELMMIMMMMI